jgi:hypothetical protein
MRLILLAAFAAALILFGCSNLSDDPVETPATPSVNVPAATPSVVAPVATPCVDVPATVPVTKTSAKHRKRHHHHHRHRHPGQTAGACGRNGQ